jgi:hypothetical protein
MCLYNRRLDRMTVYQSGDDFGLEQCSDILGHKRKSHMSVRRYIGMEITKARSEKINLVQKSLPKKRGRK